LPRLVPIGRGGNGEAETGISPIRLRCPYPLGPSCVSTLLPPPAASSFGGRRTTWQPDSR
jgi:hypothetical protein